MPHPRNSFQSGFLRVFNDLKMVREIGSRFHGCCINALNPHIAVPEFSSLVGLHQKGVRMREISMVDETHTLLDLFHTSAVTKYGILVLGSASTTGYGKTSMCIRLAIEWVKAYHEEQKTPAEDAIVVFTNTIDGAREVAWKPGMFWVLDEVSPSDREQLIYASENSFKTMLNPAISRTIRARNKDFVVPAMVPIVLNGNGDDFDSWFGNRIPWSPPIRRKTIAFQITEPLIAPQCREAGTAFSNPEAEAVAAAMRHRLHVPEAAPAPASWPQRLASLVVRGLGEWLHTEVQ